MSDSYVGSAGVARKISKIYIGVNGVARKVKKAWIGVNGVAREVYSGSLPATLSDLSVARYRLSSCTRLDGSVIVAGGRSSSEWVTTVEVYNTSGVRSTLPSLSFAGQYPPGIALLKGSGGVLVFPSGLTVNHYSTSGQRTSWADLPGGTYGRASAGAASVGDGVAVFGGGSSRTVTTVTYISPTGVQSAWTDLSSGVKDTHTTTLTDGRAVCMCGYTYNAGINGGSRFSSMCNVYSTTGQRTAPSVRTASIQKGAIAALGNGGWIFAGGYTSSAVLNTVYHYSSDLVQTLWTPMSVARRYLAAGTLGDGSVVIVGGGLPSTPWDSTALVEHYSMTGQRTIWKNLMVDREYPTASSIGGGEVLVCGGVRNDSVIGDLITGAVDAISEDIQ